LNQNPALPPTQDDRLANGGVNDALAAGTYATIDRKLDRQLVVDMAGWQPAVDPLFIRSNRRSISQLWYHLTEHEAGATRVSGDSLCARESQGFRNRAADRAAAAG
jgi:hypothetical protein